MVAVHGIGCNSRTFPMKCRSCGESVFFFVCDHDSRVLFDELGWPWPIHDCFMQSEKANGSSSRPKDRSGKQAWDSLYGVTFSIEDSVRMGLLPGLKRGNAYLEVDVTKRIKDAQNQPREIMRLDPYGTTEEEIVGAVQDITELNLGKRFGVSQNSIGFDHIAKTIGSGDVVQLTIIVDDLARDPDAIDFLSYKVLCPAKIIPSSTEIGAIVRALIRPTELLDTSRVWTSKAIEHIL